MNRRLEEIARDAARDAVAEMASNDPPRVPEHLPGEEVGSEPVRAFPRPLGVRELLDVPEPEDAWLFEGLVPLDGNLLIAGYPKSHKTNFILEAAVSAASATPFLGRFAVPRRFRVGLVLMEDRAPRIRKRLHRICQAHGLRLEDLEGWLYIWFRPPLRLSHGPTMREIAEDVEACELDALFIDNWALVSTGNSNDADEVTPQLAAAGGLREVRPLTVGLVHHARKTTKDNDGTRLTDAIRNSGAFGAWYDSGFVLSRVSETSPVGVRAELRDHPSPEPFSFNVQDEYPAGPDTGRIYPDGYLRLVASEQTVEAAEREEKAEKLLPAVLAFLRENDGCSKSALEKGVTGNTNHVRAAFDLLCRQKRAEFRPPVAKGMPGRCYLLSDTLAQPRSPLAQSGVSDPPRSLALSPLGEEQERGSGPSATQSAERGSGQPCTGCGKYSFPSPRLCFGCMKAQADGQDTRPAA